jgi:hypothetical protein
MSSSVDRRRAALGLAPLRRRTVRLSQSRHRSILLRSDVSEERRWRVAVDEHEVAVRELLAICARIPTTRWQRAPAPGTWSPSEVVLHLCRAYELGRDATDGGPGMRLLVSPSRAWALRTLLLPAILLTRRFPRRVRAPAEVTPDASERSLPDVGLARLERVAQEAAVALRRAGDVRPVPR